MDTTCPSHVDELNARTEMSANPKKGWSKAKSGMKRLIHFRNKETIPEMLTLKNPYLLSKIFEYLDIPSLKVARLVSKFWEEEAIPLLKARTVSTFRISNPSWKLWSKSGHHPDKRLYLHPVGSRRTVEKLREFDAFLIFPKLHENLIPIRITATWFPRGSFLFPLLSSKLSQNLTQLEVCMDFESCAELPKLPLPCTPLQSLKSLELNFKGERLDREHIPKKDPPQNCARQLLPFCQMVAKISLTSCQSMHNFWVFKEIMRFSKRFGFPNLVSINGTTIEPIGLQLLKELREQSGGKLEINEMNWRVEKTFSDEDQI